MNNNNNNTTFESQRQDSLKRRWQDQQDRTYPNYYRSNIINRQFAAGGGGVGFDDDINDLVSSVVPPVTVVLEGRSICQRISLHKHASYQSLAKALRGMFVDEGSYSSEKDLDLSNAVPGHLIAYEDMENDLLLVGDLNWKDFVRVAKRIRILPAKENSRKGRGGA